MRIRRSWLGLLVALPLWLAGSSEADTLPEGEDFGAALTLARPTPLAEIVRDPARFAGETVLLHGRVSDVCQRKGCWAVIREGGAHVRVEFEDYGYFLPKDCVGAEAYTQGRVAVVTLSEREARHHASESRDGDPSRIEGPQREVLFTAAGVRLVRRR
ncbi:MAG: DUF4920 domain-containing protein [Myxococcales bacterium]|nr:DUF4920 domain-containing protein [Myxococcales bacterium]